MDPAASGVSINTPDGDDESRFSLRANIPRIQDAESGFGSDIARRGDMTYCGEKRNVQFKSRVQNGPVTFLIYHGK